MISKIYVRAYCRGDITKIENYEKAVNSTELYDCHHRLEIQSDGTIFTQQDLANRNMLLHRPPEELIFLSHAEHTKLHCKGNTVAKGRKWYNNGIISVMQYECPQGFKKGRLTVRREK